MLIAILFMYACVLALIPLIAFALWQMIAGDRERERPEH